jgi:hypothetical protein
VYVSKTKLCYCSCITDTSLRKEINYFLLYFVKYFIITGTIALSSFLASCRIPVVNFYSPIPDTHPSHVIKYLPCQRIFQVKVVGCNEVCILQHTLNLCTVRSFWEIWVLIWNWDMLYVTKLNFSKNCNTNLNLNLFHNFGDEMWTCKWMDLSFPFIL